ncbi:MAG: tetraacyldisaccharide 4'-kinase [Terriglobia bacterium]|nr:MAG: tetraacyldisaccharide 4'-kinase [Terriglobia bacterium]
MSAANAAAILKKRTKRLKTKGIYFLYRTVQAFGLPWLLLYFVWRGLANRGYWYSLRQRFGFLPQHFKQTGPGAIWLHAVSVGETLSSLEFLRQCRGRFPKTRIFVSATTLAGYSLAREKLGGLVDGVFYAPVDYVWAVRRVLRTLQPSLVLIAETEIWPNLFREVKRTGAGLAILNGRISDNAFGRYCRWTGFFRAVLPAADRILAQTEVMRGRFIALGAIAERTHAAGNWKFDFEPRPAPQDSPVLEILKSSGAQQIWIAASTMPPAAAGDPDEDDAVIAAFGQLSSRFEKLLLILAPRKPERFEEAANKLKAAGVGSVRRSQLGRGTLLSLPGVLLLDSIGELSGLFAVADVVFMGGTLAMRGGHNILEPALFSKPVIAGPHMENFQAIADEFRRAGAWVEIASAGELAGSVASQLEAPERARAIGERARAAAQAQRGASGRALEAAAELYCRHLPRYLPAQPWRAAASGLSVAWAAGARQEQRRQRANRQTLEVPVISIGNITMGGTGKTPCVLSLAEHLKAEGRRPGILTRGYGRQSPERQLIVPEGADIATERTGDEPQLFIRSRFAPVGIGKDRFAAGQLLAQEFAADVLLLDDGFQHVQLARTLDIVLVDALNPFGGGHLFPAGRLREPLEGLQRADVLVITRAGFTDLAKSIEFEIRKWNPKAPVFRADFEPRAWVGYPGGERYALDSPPFQRAEAFCGLGNPESFRRSLENLGIRLANWLVFEDHHRYRPSELRRLRDQALAKGADALVTTAKDCVNLSEAFGGMLEPLPLYWLEAVFRIEHEGEFWDRIARATEQTKA